VAGCLLLAFTALYLFTASLRGPMAGDSGVMLQTAQHLLAPLHGEALDRASLSKFGLGQPLLDLTVAWVMDHGRQAQGAQAVLWMLVIAALGAGLAAASVTMVFLCACRLGYSMGVSLATALVAGLTTMTWCYAQGLYADSMLGLCWAVSLWALLVYRGQGGVAWAAIGGAAAAYAVLCKFAALPAMLVLWLFALGLMRHRRRFWPDAAALLVPGLLLGALLLGYNVLRYGDVLQMGYNQGRDASMGFNTPLWVGLHGLLLSTGKGFFFYNPSLLLALVGLPWMARDHRGPAWLIGSISVAAVLVHAPWWAWHGDWSWGPRFLAGLPPLLALGVAPVLARWGRWRWPTRATVAALILMGALVQMPGLLISPASYIRLTAKHCAITTQPFYDAQSWPIHNDGYYRHYIPQLSPLVGHVWMMRVVHASPYDRAALLASPPWRQFNPLWIPRNVPQSLLTWNVWWLYAWQVGIPGATSLGLGALALLLTALLGFWAAIRRARSSPSGSGC
jgi:hypothetical protein